MVQTAERAMPLPCRRAIFSSSVSCLRTRSARSSGESWGLSQGRSGSAGFWGAGDWARAALELSAVARAATNRREEQGFKKRICMGLRARSMLQRRVQSWRSQGCSLQMREGAGGDGAGDDNALAVLGDGGDLEQL